jgi:hypothetical protein
MLRLYLVAHAPTLAQRQGRSIVQYAHGEWRPRVLNTSGSAID